LTSSGNRDQKGFSQSMACIGLRGQPSYFDLFAIRATFRAACGYLVARSPAPFILEDS
jgi:hypothetical protein